MVEANLSQDERELMAAEYALGLNDGEERAAAMRMQLADAGFAALIQQWHKRFAALYRQYPSVEAPPAILGRIHADIRRNNSDRNEAGALHTVTQMSTQSRHWRRLAISASAIAASLAIILVVRPDIISQPAPPVDSQIASEPAQLQTVAQLSGEQPELFAVLKWTAQNNTLDVRTTGIDSGSKVPELWVIAGDGVPQSLGQIEPNSATNLTIDSDLGKKLADGATIAMTFEESSSGRTASPTLPIVATGRLSEI